jgi:hypothetical protein
MFLSFKAWESEGAERVDELCEVMVIRLKVLSLSAQINHNTSCSSLSHALYIGFHKITRVLWVDPG